MRMSLSYEHVSRYIGNARTSSCTSGANRWIMEKIFLNRLLDENVKVFNRYYGQLQYFPNIISYYIK